jgi:hypothetical protein
LEQVRTTAATGDIVRPAAAAIAVKAPIRNKVSISNMGWAKISKRL